MPEYRATRLINTREADTHHFTAESDQAAREMLLLADNLEWSGDADLVDCDVADEVLALDRRNEDGSYETVEDEIELPGQRPYGAAAKMFVRKVADLAGEGAYDDAIQTLIWLIEEAQALCNVSEATASEPVSLPKTTRAHPWHVFERRFQPLVRPDDTVLWHPSSFPAAKDLTVATGGPSWIVTAASIFGLGSASSIGLPTCAARCRGPMPTCLFEYRYD